MAKTRAKKNIKSTCRASVYQPGKDPEADAWYTAFFIENHIDYYAYPDLVASPEQVRFMVYVDDKERFYPCSDIMFEAIIGRNSSEFIQGRYLEVLQKVLDLIERSIENETEKKYLKALVTIKYKHEKRDEMLIPSRLEKRLLKIFHHRTQIEDPLLAEKNASNRRAGRALNSKVFLKAINHLDLSSDLRNPPTTLIEIKERVEHLELKRLFSLISETALWTSDHADAYTMKDYLTIFKRPLTGKGVKPLLDFLGIRYKDNQPEISKVKKILWIADEAGEIIIDLAIIKYLAKLGHKIIIAFKEASFFNKITISDAQDDETLSAELKNASLVTDNNLNKNDLIKTLRIDTDILVISDGTREKLNLMLTSTTFARIFKEVDGVISRGADQKNRFFDTHFQFTQDVFNISRDKDGLVSVSYKPKHPCVIKFSHKDLEKKARKIIDQMSNARERGMTVVFYSGIIGSIPGKIDVAKKIMSVFITHLKKQYSKTFIINPSEYYEPGMDADDLMYMWEIVQRSGYIDHWRFQTYDDIVTAFQILKHKVPPEWVGKDATYSTGCTKEMAIALDVLQKHPEMQIMGPAKEKFMRRKEYGIGKMYDRRLVKAL